MRTSARPQGRFDWPNGCFYIGTFTSGAMTGTGEFHWGNDGNENFWQGEFENASPKKGTYGYGRCDGTLGYIYINAETGGWEWYNGTLPDGKKVVNGQIVEE